MLQRTAKSCGPDAPTLASSLRSCVGPTGLRQDISAGDGGKQARSPGRARRKPLKPLRAGTSGDSGVLVVTRVRSTTTKCTRGRGCQGHPAFPTPSLGGRFINASGALRREGANACLELECRHCDRDRGEPHDSSPPTPPYIRVRIRRFDRLSWLGTATVARPSDLSEAFDRAMASAGLLLSRQGPRGLPAACAA